ncbi:hypothetical protein [Neptunomonas japonica]|uniref:Uncharacterized protein n=1 Tax=Neptunomonas japonica JAMM 1380 TaxID=1441457 RepID=A0A7R6PR36_9GAMM|nr:hypothetical protein [Neptunomonas japonica]BBB28865.1 hypothetical protein NEJAP_0908 [Neptunomonas japonica JAMM 1380]
MRRLLLGVVVGILPFTSAFADVASDLETGQPMASIFSNAQAQGSSVESILGSVIASNSGLGAEAVCSAVTLEPANAASLAEFAIASGLPSSAVATSAMQCAPEQAPAVFSRMQELGVPNDELLASALEAGQDPTTLLEATAAGNPQAPGLNIAPGQRGRPVTPPPFGSNAGGGGGGNASPS